MAQQTDISPERMERFRAAYEASKRDTGVMRPNKLQWWEMDSEFSRILHGAEVLFYCPACEAMAYIGKIHEFKFDPAPWRRDTFGWKNDPINPPVKY